jgi:hypothetical protein
MTPCKEMALLEGEEERRKQHAMVMTVTYISVSG